MSLLDNLVSCCQVSRTQKNFQSVKFICSPSPSSKLESLETAEKAKRQHRTIYRMTIMLKKKIRRWRMEFWIRLEQILSIQEKNISQVEEGFDKIQCFCILYESKNLQQDLIKYSFQALKKHSKKGQSLKKLQSLDICKEQKQLLFDYWKLQKRKQMKVDLFYSAIKCMVNEKMKQYWGSIYEKKNTMSTCDLAQIFVKKTRISIEQLEEKSHESILKFEKKPLLITRVHKDKLVEDLPDISDNTKMWIKGIERKQNEEKFKDIEQLNIQTVKKSAVLRDRRNSSYSASLTQTISSSHEDLIKLNNILCSYQNSPTKAPKQNRISIKDIKNKSKNSPSEIQNGRHKISSIWQEEYWRRRKQRNKAEQKLRQKTNKIVISLKNRRKDRSSIGIDVQELKSPSKQFC